jgi:hypothetical protein
MTLNIDLKNYILIKSTVDYLLVKKFKHNNF